MWHKIYKFANENHPYIIAGGIVICLLLWTGSCESKVKSLNDPLQLVTRAELELELDTMIAAAEIRFANLDKQDSLKRILLENAALFAQGGAINPYGLINTVIGVMAIGTAVDRNRKYKRVKTELKTKNANTP